MKSSKKNLLRTYVAGYSHYHSTFPKVGDELKLIREPKNKYDSNAIVIKTIEGRKIGYVSMKLGDNRDKRFKKSFDKALPIRTTVVEVDKAHQFILIDISFSPEAGTSTSRIRLGMRGLLNRHCSETTK